jgi:phospholipase/carboxylesterase
MPMSTEPLTHRLRPAAGEPQGALILLHGRGADENDLFPIFDILDPEQRYVGACPRGPLSLPPGGAHWYAVKQVGYPDPDTFFPTYERASAWLDGFLAEQGLTHERAVVGGFSQGAVMSYALSLGKGRPRPAGIMAFSGFIPEVPGFGLDLDNLKGYPVAIGHGTYDPVITVDFGRHAKNTLEKAGADVLYQESPMAHTIDPAFLNGVRPWLTARLT